MEPNFSIVLPGKCNAKCEFCFWKQKEIHPQYMDELRKVVKRLPEEFWQCSLTGGEPLLSPQFTDILKFFAKEKPFQKVVLTTNGTLLYKRVTEQSKLFRAVNHVNISRHRVDDAENRKIFGTESVPDTAELKAAVSECNKLGIDVNFNVVISDFTKTTDIYDMIHLAKECNVTSVCFRKEHGNLRPTPAEKSFNKVHPLSIGKCPVCRSKVQLIEGMRVTWLVSVIEPKEVLRDSVYELVFHPEGVLSCDWQARTVVELTQKREMRVMTPQEIKKRQELLLAKKKIAAQLAKIENELLVLTNRELKMKKPAAKVSGGGGCGIGSNVNWGCGGMTRVLKATIKPGTKKPVAKKSPKRYYDSPRSGCGGPAYGGGCGR
jgi:pyruvate-formate lyase-activating enzyme